MTFTSFQGKLTRTNTFSALVKPMGFLENFPLNPVIRTRFSEIILSIRGAQDGADMDVAEDADFWSLGQLDTQEENMACVQQWYRAFN